jgi:putative DNA primase/helicase
MFTDDEDFKGRGTPAQDHNYPDGFIDWPEDRKNAFFAGAAQEYREKRSNGNGHAGQLIPKAEAAWRPSLTCLSDVRSEPISWLWPGWLARGKMHIIAGQPGVGKSTLAMKMAAVVSSGGRWPDGSAARQGNVVIWSGEDDLSDTLGPRLLASGADRSRVFFVSGMNNGHEARPFDPAKDIPELQAALEAAGGASLLVIDPVVSATAGDSHKNGETRRGLQPLVDLAAGLNAALLGVTHFSKGTQGRSPIDRVTGSLAFAALARIVMIATKTEEGTGPRTLMRAKSNISQDEGGFQYSLRTEALHEQPNVIASVVAWGDAVEGTARSVLAAAEEGEPDDGDEMGGASLREAKTWLAEFLLDGPALKKEIDAAARAHCHNPRTVRRAKKDLGVLSIRDGATGPWSWVLPHGQVAKNEEESLHPENFGHLGHLEDSPRETQVAKEPHMAQVANDIGEGHVGQDFTADDDGAPDPWEQNNRADASLDLPPSTPPASPPSRGQDETFGWECEI